jgi:hypothetical protein
MVSMTTLSEKDGLPQETYKVYIIGAIENNPDEKILSLIATEYIKEETTPLEISVPGENVYNITVKKP